jgi:hypothetical protein
VFALDGFGMESYWSYIILSIMTPPMQGFFNSLVYVRSRLAKYLQDRGTSKISGGTNSSSWLQPPLSFLFGVLHEGNSLRMFRWIWRGSSKESDLAEDQLSASNTTKERSRECRGRNSIQSHQFTNSSLPCGNTSLDLIHRTVVMTSKNERLKWVEMKKF